MLDTDERASMQREIEEVMRKYGIRSTGLDFGDLSSDDYQRVRTIAMHIVQGNIDLTEFTALSDKLKASVDAFVRHLIGLIELGNAEATIDHHPVLMERIGGVFGHPALVLGITRGNQSIVISHVIEPFPEGAVPTTICWQTQIDNQARPCPITFQSMT